MDNSSIWRGLSLALKDIDKGIVLSFLDDAVNDDNLTL